MANPLNVNPNIPEIPDNSHLPLQKEATQSQISSTISEIATMVFRKREAFQQAAESNTSTYLTLNSISYSGERDSSSPEIISSSASSHSSNLKNTIPPPPPQKLSEAILFLFEEDSDDADYALEILRSVSLPPTCATMAINDPEVIDYQISILQETFALLREEDTSERTLENLIFIATLHDLKNKGKGLSEEKEEVLKQCFNNMENSLARGRLCELLAGRPEVFQLVSKEHLESSLTSRALSSGKDTYKEENDALNAFIGSAISLSRNRADRNITLNSEVGVIIETSPDIIPLKTYPFPEENPPDLELMTLQRFAEYRNAKKDNQPQIVEIESYGEQLVSADFMQDTVQFLNNKEFYEGDIYLFLKRHGHERLSGDELFELACMEGLLCPTFDPTFDEAKAEFIQHGSTLKILTLLFRNTQLTAQEATDLKKLVDDKITAITAQVSDLENQQEGPETLLSPEEQQEQAALSTQVADPALISLQHELRQLQDLKKRLFELFP